MSVQTSSMYARHSSFGPSLPTSFQPGGGLPVGEPDRILFFVVDDDSPRALILIRHRYFPFASITARTARRASGDCRVRAKAERHQPPNCKRVANDPRRPNYQQINYIIILDFLYGRSCSCRIRRIPSGHLSNSWRRDPFAAGLRTSSDPSLAESLSSPRLERRAPVDLPRRRYQASAVAISRCRSVIVTGTFGKNRCSIAPTRSLRRS